MNPNKINTAESGNNENAWQAMANEVIASQGSPEVQEVPNYKRVEDVPGYVKDLMESGVEAITAEKFARIGARKGQIGEQVTSWSVDAEGNPIIEKQAEVVADESGEAGWVVTKMDENGNPIIDENGHPNEWIISNETFQKKYEDDPEHPGVYKPKGGPQQFVRTSEAITINQWGSEMNVDAGGYINVTNPDDMYVISGRDFEDTYKEIESE